MFGNRPKLLQFDWTISCSISPVGIKTWTAIQAILQSCTWCAELHLFPTWSFRIVSLLDISRDLNVLCRLRLSPSPLVNIIHSAVLWQKSERTKTSSKYHKSHFLPGFFAPATRSFFAQNMNSIFSKDTNRMLSDKLNTPSKKETSSDSNIDRALTPNTTANTNLNKKSATGPIKRKRNDDSTASHLFRVGSLTLIFCT